MVVDKIRTGLRSVLVQYSPLMGVERVRGLRDVECYPSFYAKRKTRVGGAQHLLKSLIPLFLSCVLVVWCVEPVQATGHILPSKPTKAPAAWDNFCERERWACTWQTSGRVTDEAAMIKVGHEVNSFVNATIREITDQAQYRSEDYWALPTKQGGDCEDLALLKKQMLIKRGVSPDRLFIATVLDRSKAPHAVLVMRTPSRDFVLDNLSNTLKVWQKTGYSFLKIQDNSASTGWSLVMQGGVFR